MTTPRSSGAGMIGRRLESLAAPMARRPGRFVAIATVLCLLAAAGLVRWSVDPGEDLLVGSTSQAAVTNNAETVAFGSDPLVVDFTSKSKEAPFLERNLERFTALEDDLRHDPRVATVIGPGTIAQSFLDAAQSQKQRIATEYPLYFAESYVLAAEREGETSQAKLSEIYSDASSIATSDLLVQTLRGTADAELARETANKNPAGSARLIDSGEKAADAAAAKDMPALFAEYLAGPGGTPDPATAEAVFGRLTAAYGLCDSQIAAALRQTTTNCQVFFERAFLDLANCPTFTQAQAGEFCPPKPQWDAVFPQGTGTTTAVITVRLTAAAAADPAQVRAVRDKVNQALATGLPDDAYMLQLQRGVDVDKTGESAAGTQARYNELKSLGPLAPTECATEQASSTCQTAYHDAVVPHVIAGGALLAAAVSDSLTRSLLAALPIIALLMLIILIATFRLRGVWLRVTPLLSAALATGTVFGLALISGTHLNPALLAAVPVLVGLGVDYAVQIVARYDEEARDATREDALRATLAHCAPATLAAAIATLAGVAVLAVVTGIDGVGLVAVPLMAEFAIVVGAGVAVAWVLSIAIALPLAAMTRRDGTDTQIAPRKRRNVRIASGGALRSIVAIAIVTSLVGWALLPSVPVQTDPELLLASNLPELNDIGVVQADTGYSNEIDIYVTGDVAGPYTSAAAAPTNITWLCEASATIRAKYAAQVKIVTSLGDVLLATSNGDCGTVPTTTAPSSSPGATPQTTPSPVAALTPRGALAAFHRGATPAPTPAAATPAAISTSPAATAPANSVPQTSGLCTLRALPDLASALVAPLNFITTKPCPAENEYTGTFVTPDTTPIDPTSTRIVLGVGGTTTSIADEASLVDDLNNDLSSPPGGMHASVAGLPVLAASAYDAITHRTLLFNIAPLLAVALALAVVARDWRRTLLPLLPAALAAGWSALLIDLMSHLPDGATLGTFSPLTVMMGSLVVALGTEFGVVLLARFREECAGGADADTAAAAALSRTGRAIVVSALTLAGGFVVLALNLVLPDGIPLLGAFGLSVVLDLALAVGAVFFVMLPLAVAWEKRSPTPRLVLATSDAPRRGAGRVASGKSAPTTGTKPTAAKRATSKTATSTTAPSETPATTKGSTAKRTPAKGKSTPSASPKRTPAAKPPKPQPRKGPAANDKFSDS